MRSLVIVPDANMDFPTWLAVQSDTINALSLAAGVAESSTVPAGAGKVLFGATGNYNVKVNGTATVPGDTTDGSASELNPMGYKVNPGDVISIIASAACIVTLAYYR